MPPIFLENSSKASSADRRMWSVVGFWLYPYRFPGETAFMSPPMMVSVSLESRITFDKFSHTSSL